ncbi:MAG: hypothetical protein AABZ74_02365 [Cyanobacteriota bacterium]
MKLSPKLKYEIEYELEHGLTEKTKYISLEIFKDKEKNLLSNKLKKETAKNKENQIILLEELLLSNNYY